MRDPPLQVDEPISAATDLRRRHGRQAVKLDEDGHFVIPWIYQAHRLYMVEHEITPRHDDLTFVAFPVSDDLVYRHVRSRVG
jgi:hypothetical protein